MRRRKARTCARRASSCSTASCWMRMRCAPRPDSRDGRRRSIEMPKMDVAAVPARKGSGYPPPFDAPCATRTRKRLGDAEGLRDFGVNLMTLPPGGWSSQRNWHSHEDELVYLLEGELVLVEDGGETVLRAGDCAAFPK